MKTLELKVKVNNRYDKKDIIRIINAVHEAGSYLVKEAIIEDMQWIENKGFINNNKKTTQEYKAYEFGLDKFAYYALIKARTEREAINYYKDTVADIDNYAKPKCCTGVDNIFEHIKRWITDIKKEDVLNILKEYGPQLLLLDGCLE